MSEAPRPKDAGLERVRRLLLPGRAPRRVPWNRSLRLKVLGVVLAVLLFPQGLVFGWFLYERRYPSRMEMNAAFAAREAERAVAEGKSLETVARLHLVRVRRFDETGHVVLDVDADEGRDTSQRIGDLFLGKSPVPTLDELDEIIGPIWLRSEVADALRGTPKSGCRTSPDATLIVCHAARKIPGGVLYVQDGSRRPMVHLAYLGFHLPRLLIATLPFALLLAWWMGRRVVRPLEKLRTQAIQKTREASPRADLEVAGGDEMKDLATAFNTLLETLEKRRGDNEAFVADLVHEFKNPVATVRACAEALERTGEGDERSARLARLLAESSRRLDTLVSQFLELARAEGGMQKEPWSKVDLAELARGLTATMREDSRFQGVSFEVSASEPAPAFGVPYRFDSVLRNLLENAASFSGEGGKVSVEIETTAETVIARVKDSGPGIAAEDLPKVFERFFTTRGRERGTGLGLALARAVIEAQGGSVSAASEEAKGATFTVVLPRATG